MMMGLDGLIYAKVSNDSKPKYKVLRYVNIFRDLNLPYQRFYSKSLMVNEIKHFLNTDEIYFYVDGKFIDEVQRKFILAFKGIQFASYLDVEKQIDDYCADIICDRIDLVNDAKYALYDIFIKHNSKYYSIHELTEKEIRYIHNLERLIPHLIDECNIRNSKPYSKYEELHEHLVRTGLEESEAMRIVNQLAFNTLAELYD